ncbi:MAG: hypothetical protein MZV63_39920 [Marinilabiliales bacterium]|nr:hypothetical protein [Marinilabiliales bacterium]
MSPNVLAGSVEMGLYETSAGLRSAGVIKRQGYNHRGCRDEDDDAAWQLIAG